METLQLKDGRVIAFDRDDFRYFTELVREQMGEDAGRYFRSIVEEPDYIIGRVSSIAKCLKAFYFNVDLIESKLNASVNKKLTLDQSELKKLDDEIRSAADGIWQVYDDLYDLCLDFGVML